MLRHFRSNLFIYFHSAQHLGQITQQTNKHNKYNLTGQTHIPQRQILSKVSV